MKIFNFIFLCLLSCSFAFGQLSEGVFYKVKKVVDGDTFWLYDSDGDSYKIRLIGVNTPEAYTFGNVREQEGGKEASAYTKYLLEGEYVRLEFDVEKYDRYNRVLAYVWLHNGEMLNAKLVDEGHAEAVRYYPNVKYYNYFKSLEE
jgi:micrococcal nuclease